LRLNRFKKLLRKVLVPGAVSRADEEEGGEPKGVATRMTNREKN